MSAHTARRSTARECAPGSVVAGVDIGGTTIQVVLCTPQLEVVDAVESPTPARDGGDAVVRCVLESLKALQGRTGAEPHGIGVGAAGVIDERAGTVLVASDTFRGWAGYPLAPELTTRTGLPVFVDNDVNAFLRGEAATGAAQGRSSALGVALGTGVGGALLLDGALVVGEHGAAGEIGHIPGFGDRRCSCGQRGHLESIASGWAISKRYGELTGRVASAREVAHAARLGDAEAIAIFESAGCGLARAAVMVAGLVDITTVVIGGGVGGAWSLLQPAVTTALSQEPPVSGHTPQVVRGTLGRHAVAIGAAARVIEELIP